MTLKIRHRYRDRGDHLSFYDVSEYVFDPRDLDKDGKPPRWMKTPEPPDELADGEIEFDHAPSQADLRAAFPEFYARAAAPAAKEAKP
jgi:hypothetical protein